MKKVWVTGGAGYIGSLLVRLLLEKGYHVRVLDNLSFGGESLIDLLDHKHFEFQNGNVRIDADITSAVKGIDYIAHLVAIVGDPACRKFSDDAIEIYMKGSKNLYKKAEEAV